MRYVLTLLWCLFAAGLVTPSSACRAAGTLWDPYIALIGGILAPAAPQESIRMDVMEMKIFLNEKSYEIDVLLTSSCSRSVAPHMAEMARVVVPGYPYHVTQ